MDDEDIETVGMLDEIHDEGLLTKAVVYPFILILITLDFIVGGVKKCIKFVKDVLWIRQTQK